MNRETGRIRYLSQDEQPKITERLFKIGEKLFIKDCYFEIIGIRIAPYNEVTLKGIPAPFPTTIIK